MMSEGTRSEAEYPKMVYPHSHGEVGNQHAGSPDAGEFKGVIVHSAEEEAEVMKNVEEATPKGGWGKPAE